MELRCRLDEEEVFGPPKRVPELVDNKPPMFMDLNGIGTSSWERDLSGFLGSKLLNSDVPMDVFVVVFMGIDDISSGIWVSKFDPILLFISPWFTLLFSSANASQKALWVIKLSLLHTHELRSGFALGFCCLFKYHNLNYQSVIDNYICMRRKIKTSKFKN